MIGRNRTVSRNLIRQRQDVWFCEFTEKNVGVDRVKVYGKPDKHKMSVSATAGYVGMWAIGFTLNYDRYITSYERDFQPKEGTAVFVDVKPSIDKQGNLTEHKVFEYDIKGNPRLDENGNQIYHMEYDTSPDYIIEKIYDTDRGNVARYGIKKL